jgi:hypothetical protein
VNEVLKELNFRSMPGVVCGGIQAADEKGAAGGLEGGSDALENRGGSDVLQVELEPNCDFARFGRPIDAGRSHYHDRPAPRPAFKPARGRESLDCGLYR